MKTRRPLILTARIAEKDLETFDRLRRAYFPPDRNFLRAHLTVFHRLPGEYSERIVASLEQAASGFDALTAEVTGLWHLGAGVAYSINCQPLQEWGAPNEIVALVGALVTGLGCALVYPALGVEALKRVLPANRGSAMGAFSAFLDIAYGLAGPAGGIVAGWFGYAAVYMLGCICALLGAALVVKTPARRS